MGASCRKENAVVVEEANESHARAALPDGSGTSPDPRIPSVPNNTDAHRKLKGKFWSSKLFSNRKSNKAATAPAAFSSFSDLSDDMILCILSYVSYAPTEMDESGNMNLSTLASPRVEKDLEELQRLLNDFNAGAYKLDKALGKTAAIPPFRSGHFYFHEAYHGERAKSSTELGRISSPRVFGTLTHVFPLVSKRMYRLCHEPGILWKEAIERLLLRKNWYSPRDGFNDLFGQGIMSFIASMQDCEPTESESGSNQGRNDAHAEDESRYERMQALTTSAPSELQPEGGNKHERAQSLINKACILIKEKDVSRYAKELGSQPSVVCHPNGAIPADCPGAIAKQVLCEVLAHHQPTRMPMLLATQHPVLNKPIDRRLTDDQQKLLIHSLMMGRDEDEQRGHPIFEPRPRFLMYERRHTTEVTTACVAEVRKCVVHKDDTVDIMVVPLSWVLIENVTVRPDSGSLREAVIAQHANRTQMPLFHMRNYEARLGEPIHLEADNPWKQMLVADIMTGRSDSERRGGTLAEPLPEFIFAFTDSLEVGNTACIVEVRQCHIHRNRLSNLRVVPRCWVLIEQLSQRPYTRGLVDATVVVPS